MIQVSGRAGNVRETPAPNHASGVATSFDLYIGGDTPRPFRRLDLLVAGLFLLLALLYVAPKLTGGRVFSASGGDVEIAWFWWHSDLGAALRSGRLPQINPYEMAGSPLLASSQRGVFYPINWAAALLPVGLMINASTILHLWLGLVGMYGLARAWGRSGPASAVAALMFGFSGFVVLHVWQGHLVFLAEAAWTPFVLWAWIAMQRQASRRAVRWQELLPSTLGVASLLALQFLPGQPQISYFTLLLLAAFQAGWVSWALRYRSWGGAATGTAALSAALLFSGALVAVQLLPSASIMGLSVRAGGLSLERAQISSMHPSGLFSLVAPWLFGGAPGGLPYLSDASATESFWETTGYWGAAGGVLALLGLLGDTRRVPFCWVLAGVIALALGIALGKYGELHALLFGKLPGLNLFRAPGRFLFPATVAVALLAAGGMDLLLREAQTELRRLRRTAGALLGFLAALGVLAVILFADGAAAPAFRDLLLSRLPTEAPQREIVAAVLPNYYRSFSSGLLLAGGMALGVLIAAMFLPGTRWRSLGRWGVTAALFVELAAFAWTYRDSNDPARFHWPQEVARYFQSAGPRWRIGSAVSRTDFSQGAAWNVRHVGGTDPFMIWRYARALQVSQGLPGSPEDWSGQLKSSPFTRACAMRHILVPAAFETSGTLLTVAAEGPGYKVLRDDGALPRGYVVTQTRIMPPGEPTIQAVNAGDFDPRATVILNEQLPSHLQAEPSSDGRSLQESAGDVAILVDEPEHFVARVEMKRGGWFVLMDQFLPGWTATVDGRPARMFLANSAGRALPLDAGAHDIEMRYRTPGLALGATISALSWSGGLAALGWALRRRRHMLKVERS